jgi:GH24 family phage-related lysozyme (muramidase)
VNTSEKGIAFIKANEGFAPKPTNDNGHVMWGHGHDQKPGEAIPDLGITLPEADALLATDLAEDYDPHVAALAPWANQNQHDALADFGYNEGVAALATMLHHGESQVTTQMAAWCYEHVNGVLTKSEGLAARRAREIALYVS